MSSKIEATTASVASAAASSPIWLPSAQDTIGVAASPLWAALLAPLGVLWLVIQIGFYLYEKWKLYRGADHGEQ
ncbi:MAG: hypothetical protein QUV08_12550 [Parasphingorhabdus sp.]|jgi:hypothetical protein|nr:hypothetical protein [Parasphingorhabdus sp.]|tara:strand:- start:315 stop:536 length:222 start_codon:yes stop_codon:yes gene_type:complete